MGRQDGLVEAEVGEGADFLGEGANVLGESSPLVLVGVVFAGAAAIILLRNKRKA